MLKNENKMILFFLAGFLKTINLAYHIYCKAQAKGREINLIATAPPPPTTGSP